MLEDFAADCGGELQQRISQLVSAASVKPSATKHTDGDAKLEKEIQRLSRLNILLHDGRHKDKR